MDVEAGGAWRGFEESRPKSSFDLVINTVGFTSWREMNGAGPVDGFCIEMMARRKVNVTWNEIVLFCRGGGRKEDRQSPIEGRCSFFA